MATMFDRLEILKNNGFTAQYIVDVGAHIGNFAKSCQNLWPNVDIHMFEANPYANEVLKSIGFTYNIALLSDVVGEKYTYYMTNKWLLSSGNSIFRENTSEFNDDHVIKYELESNTLDNILKNDKKVDLLKLDTQRSEIKILNGGLNLVARTKYIIIESSIYNYNEGGCLIGDVFDFMNAHGFKLIDILDINYFEEGITLNQLDLLFKNTNVC
jgi:FkbM family methyltransferase